MPITFSSQDINLTSFPHIDAMVTTVHIDRWDITKILIDRDNQAKILFGGKRIEPVRTITLLVFFDIPKNAHTEYITFDVINLAYPYNAIFGRVLLNTFEAALHSVYHCLKVLATFGVISVFGSQQEARNIEKGFALGHKNVHFL
jgi:hypothetical protein